MGCNYSEQTKEQFDKTISEQEAVISQLMIKKNQLMNSISGLGVTNTHECDLKGTKEEFYTKVKEIEKAVPKYEIDVNSSPDINRSVSDQPDIILESSRKISESYNPPKRTGFADILNDPSIKAIVDQKRQQLEMMTPKNLQNV